MTPKNNPNTCFHMRCHRQYLVIDMETHVLSNILKNIYTEKEYDFGYVGNEYDNIYNPFFCFERAVQTVVMIPQKIQFIMNWKV